MAATYYDVHSNVCLAAVLILFLTHACSPRLAEESASYQQPPPPPPPPARPAPPHKCFHLARDHCPAPQELLRCKKIDERSVFCCDVDDFRLKEGLASTFSSQNVSYLHILNATIEELDVDVEKSSFRRLVHMSLTDGRIGRIKGQFPKLSSLTCLNISNNQLTSGKLEGWSRPFAYTPNLSLLDVSANNLTEFPVPLTHITRKIAVDLSGNNYTDCREYLKAMEGNNSQLITFLNYNNTFCTMNVVFNWFNESQFFTIEYIRREKELNASCRQIQPTADCVCKTVRQELVDSETYSSVSVACAELHLKQLPTNLPPNTISLNVSYNNISSLAAVGEDPSYARLQRLEIDYNNVQSLYELEGTRFIDNFHVFSIRYNKLHTFHTYILSNTFDAYSQRIMLVAQNRIHCDCNTVKVLKVWLPENSKNIMDYAELLCEDGVPVINLAESRVCQQQRNWSDYIYYVIAAEATLLVGLVAKVSYDYWVFKTAGYLPWPANKMPRLPCDWLCE